MTFSGLNFFFHDSLQETYLNSLATAVKAPLNYFNGDTSTQFNGMAAKADLTALLKLPQDKEVDTPDNLPNPMPHNVKVIFLPNDHE